MNNDNKVIVSQKYLPTISTVGIFEVKEKWYHINRCQKIHCMLYVTDGKVYVSENEIDYVIKAGEVFFLKANLRHYSNRLTPIGSKWFWASFFPVDNTFNNQLILPKHIKISNSKWMFHTMSTMYQIFHSNQIHKNDIVSTLLQQIFFNLIIESKHDKAEKPKKISPLVNEILSNMIKDKFNGNVIAKKMMMDYSYLGRLYKSETGTTINQYFTYLKVQKAIELLQSTKMNITEISNYLSYPNPYYFSRVFKKVTGLSPQNYLKHIYK